MDDHRFDNLTRRLATGASRRGLLKTVLAGLVASASGVGATRSVAAATSCTSGHQCPSRICKDGFCCDRACAGQCEACNLPGREGICSAVTGRPVGNRQACPGTGVCQATCDGVRRTSCAAFPGRGVACGAATCRDGWQTTYSCGGNGACQPTTTSCGLFTCASDGSGCRTNCASDAECIGAAFCANGVCQGDQPLGQPCAEPDQCQSGFCVDGVCCVEACTEQCFACSVPGNAGFCAPTPGAACDDGDPCTVADACDTTGNCEGAPKDCSSVADPCNTGVCRAADGVCVTQPKTNGTGCNDGNACTANDQCQNGACVGTLAVTCATPGLCETSPGTCNPQNGTCTYPDAPDNTSCGMGQACCSGTCTDVTTTTNCGACGNACSAGESCAAGSCQSCGGLNQSCCAGVTCAPGLTCTQFGTCRDCGDVGESCCLGVVVGSTFCNPGAICSGGTCVDCGALDQRCCVVPAPACDAGLTCTQFGVCRDCGDAGEPCCLGVVVGSRFCNGGLTCDGITCVP